MASRVERTKDRSIWGPYKVEPRILMILRQKKNMSYVVVSLWTEDRAYKEITSQILHAQHREGRHLALQFLRSQHRFIHIIGGARMSQISWVWKSLVHHLGKEKDDSECHIWNLNYTKKFGSEWIREHQNSSDDCKRVVLELVTMKLWCSFLRYFIIPSCPLILCF